MCIRDRHIERKNFHSLLEGGRRPVGTILQIPSEELVEILGYAGMDYIVLDMEHCPMSSAKIVSMIRAAEAVGIVPLVRVPYVEDEDSIKTVSYTHLNQRHNGKHKLSLR